MFLTGCHTAVVRRWLWVCRNDSLWRLKLRSRLGEAAAARLSPGTSSWVEEYRRLVAAVPRLGAGPPACHHTGGVAQLAFSGDGQLMASCGEDARYRGCFVTSLPILFRYLD